MRVQMPGTRCPPALAPACLSLLVSWPLPLPATLGPDSDRRLPQGGEWGRGRAPGCELL